MAVIKKDGGFMALPVQIKRGNPIPLDKTSVWWDYAALEQYAKTDATAYVGQIVTYVNADAQTATAYVIANTSGELLQVGTGAGGAEAVNVDNNTIVLDEGGLLTLRDFGKQYYRYVPAVKDETTGEETTPATYQLQTVDETHPWKVGLIPQVTTDPENSSTFIIGWYEPNPTTVDGLQTAVTALQEEVAGVKSDLTENYYTKEEARAELAGAIQYRGTVATAADLDAKKADAKAGDMYIVTDTKSEYVYNEETKDWEVLGSDTNLSNLDTRIGTLETNIQTLNTDVGTLKDTTIPGLQEIVDGHTTSIGTLDTNVGTLQTDLSNLQSIVGEPASTPDGEAPKPATGIFAELQAINGQIANFGVTINGSDVPEVEGKVTLFDFTQSGSLPGLVPVPSDIVLSSENTYVLTAKGTWEQPRDTRIGTLTYNETEYTTVTDYVDARVNNVTMVWSKITE